MLTVGKSMKDLWVCCMQSLEGLDPKTKLTGASQVTLSEAEVRSLRRDMQEQENIIQGYQVHSQFPLHALCLLRSTTALCLGMWPIVIEYC